MWGTHAQAIQGAEGIKSTVFSSVVAALVTASAVPAFVFSPQQAYAENRSFVTPLVAAGATPQPLALTSGAPQLADLTQQGSIFRPLAVAQGPTVRAFVGGPLSVDLTQQGWIARPTPARQGAVPPATQGAPQLADLTLQAALRSPLTTPQGSVPAVFAGVPQADTSQLAPQFTPAQPAAAIVANPVAGFFTVPPQTDERPTRTVWASQVSGQTTPVIPQVYGKSQSDTSQISAQVMPAQIAAPITPNPLGWFFTVPPQTEDRPVCTVWASQQEGGVAPPPPPPPPPDLGGGSGTTGFAWHPIQDKYWCELAKRYKKKKKEAEKKSPAAAELVLEIAERGHNLAQALDALKTELAEEHIKQSKVYVELLKLKLELAELDEEEEEAVMLLSCEERWI